MSGVTKSIGKNYVDYTSFGNFWGNVESKYGKGDSDYVVRNGTKEILSEVKKRLEFLYNMHKDGIAGARDKIVKPGYDGNGNSGEETYVEFPSFYQHRGVGFLLQNKRILIADEMGVGKTAQAVLGKLAIEDPNTNQKYNGKKTKAIVIVPNTIKDQWVKEIDKYCKKKQTVVTIDNYSERDLEEAKDADLAIINYDIFGRNGKSKELVRKFLDMGFNYLILDEAHNVKNSNAYRSSQIKELGDSMEYLCLLSGTPMPNNLRDTYMMLSMLYPLEYPTPQHVRSAHRHQPDLISVLLRDRMLRRYITEVASLPPITVKNFDVKLSSEQQLLYNNILDNDYLEGAFKLQELRKALLDPSLVNPDIIYDKNLRGKIGEINSTKYEVLDKIVDEKIRNGEKIVIFSSSYREGVTDKLEERYRQHGVLRIDGTVAQKNRETIMTSFKTDSDKRIFIGTTATIGEGVDGNLNAANSVIFLDEPYTSDERKQAVSRVYRPGQKKPVEVVSLVVKDSVDEGVLKLQGWKDEAEKLMLQGFPMDSEHTKLLFKIRDYSTFTPLKELIYTPQQIVARLSTQMKDQGSERIKQALERDEGKIAKKYAENYLKNWETSYSANTTRAYTQIIKVLSEHVDLKRKVDLGSGPGIMSHMLDEPVTNVELNSKHFDQSFAHPNSRNIVSSFHNLEDKLMSESFDLAVMSLSLDYTLNNYKKGEITEREKSLREANRILRNGGYLILTLPDSEVDSEVSRKMQKGMTELGFEMVSGLSGLVRSANDSADFQTYVGIYKKTAEPSKNSVAENLEFKEIERKKLSYSMKKKGIVEDFVFVQKNENETLESRLKIYLEKVC